MMFSKTPLTKGLPAALMLTASALCTAQQTSGQITEQLIVTGTYSPLAVEQLTSTVTVVDRTMIEQLNKTNLADLLQVVPGVLVERQGGPGGLTVASIRGGESNYIVVMIDGVALNDPGNSRGGAFDLGNINVDSIERIEIVKGPQSAIYGADALAGVINIISRRPEQGHKATTSLAFGADGYRHIGWSALGAMENVDYALQWRSRDSGEPVPGSQADDTELNARINLRPVEDHQFSVSYRRFDGERSSYPEQSGGPEYASSPLLDYTEYQDTSAALGWQYQVSSLWQSNLQATLYQRDERFHSPGIAPYTAIPPNGADTDFERQQISWINTLGKPGQLWMDVGLERRMEQGESRGYLDFGMIIPTDFSLDRYTNSAFVSVGAQALDNLLLQGSLRHDDTDGFASELSSHLGLRYQISDSITWRANWGEGYKLPSFFALGHPLVGNIDLKPERVESWDTGIDWQVTTQLGTSLDYFDNTYRDPIDFDSELFTNVNRERIDTSGFEWQAHWRSEDHRLSLRSHATFTDIDVKDNVSVLTGRPEWRAGLTTGWRFNDSWSGSVDYQWVGEQFATSQHTGARTIHELSDYHRVDLALFWKVNKSLQVDFAVENVLDEQYQTAVGFPAPGLLWRLGFKWQPQSSMFVITN